MKIRKDVVDGVAEEVKLFITRRAEKVSQEIGSFLNINPFLLAAVSEMHELKNQLKLAEFLLAAHLATGHSTSFGKMVDERLLPNVFGTAKLNAAYRRSNNLMDSVYDDIDHEVTFDNGKTFLLSLKAGSWTIQHGQAMELYKNFKELGDKKLAKDGIVVGVFYGNSTLLTNKYDIVQGINRRHQASMTKLGFVKVKAGKEFWSWLNEGVEETQDWILEGVKKGSEEYLKGDTGLSKIFREAPSKLQQELQDKYELNSDGSLDWALLLHAVNDLPKDMSPEKVIKRKEMIEEADSSN